MHKLWGSAIQATHSVNISIKGQPSKILNKSAFLTIYGCTAGKSGIKKDIEMSLTSTTNKNTKPLNLLITGPSKDRISEVMPLSINGVYRRVTNTVSTSIYSPVESIGGSCYITEGLFPTEIILEDFSTCVGSSGKASGSCNLFMMNSGVGAVQSHMNLTLKFNPSNIVTMTLKAVGTPQTNLVNITMKPSNIRTAFIYCSMPVVHALKTAPVKLSTRGF